MSTNCIDDGKDDSIDDSIEDSIDMVLLNDGVPRATACRCTKITLENVPNDNTWVYCDHCLVHVCKSMVFFCSNCTIGKISVPDGDIGEDDRRKYAVACATCGISSHLACFPEYVPERDGHFHCHSCRPRKRQSVKPKRLVYESLDSIISDLEVIESECNVVSGGKVSDGDVSGGHVVESGAGEDENDEEYVDEENLIDEEESDDAEHESSDSASYKKKKKTTTSKITSKTKDGMLLQCQYCPVRFSSTRSLKDHHGSHHSGKTMPEVWVEQDMTKFVCYECDVVFTSNNARSAHWYAKHTSTRNKRKDRDAVSSSTTTTTIARPTRIKTLSAIKIPVEKSAVNDAVNDFASDADMLQPRPGVIATAPFSNAKKRIDTKKRPYDSIGDDSIDDDDGLTFDETSDEEGDDDDDDVCVNDLPVDEGHASPPFAETRFDGDVPLEVAFITLFPFKSLDSVARWLDKLDVEEIATVSDLRSLQQSKFELLCKKIGASFVLCRCLSLLRVSSSAR